MVLSTDVEIASAHSENRMLTSTAVSEADAEAKRQAMQQLTVPIPATVVRAYLSEFEQESLRRITLRLSGADVKNGWKDGPEGNGFQVRYGDVDGSEWPTMRTSGRLQVSAEKAARVLVAPEMVPKFDDMTRDVRVLERLSEATEVRLVSAKGVMFTTPRDFCVATTVRREASGRVIIATRSVDHPEGKQNGFVRALSMISGYVLTPDPHDPNACELTIVAHMNLGGNMPAMVIRYVGLSAPIKLAEKIREVTLAARV